ncbi:hypothetical protein PM082_024076 [Marasmius tenuissimus]|nr:hypothetical protein PM082_024076 [Marasmius tenuissimus]
MNSPIKGTVVAASSETKTNGDTHNPDIFSNIDNDITDDHYWCSLGPAKLVSTEDLVNDWDKSPQGHYHAHVSWDVAKQLDNFKVDWSTQTDTARHTSLAAGFLECGNPECARMCSDSTDPEKQYKLAHVPCFNKATIIKYAGGIWYCNSEPHNHERIPHILRLSQKQSRQLQNLVTSNPGAPPAALRAGKTVSDGLSLDISDRLGNSKAARYEINKIRPRILPSGDAFITQWVQFIHDHPNVVISNSLFNDNDGVVVISIQTLFMADQLAQASSNDDGFNGLVFNAAQKCKQPRKAFSPRSKPWIEWWERPNHVNMLVVPDGDIRSVVPNSTNAQEAAHAAMYTKHGKDHERLIGLEKLLLISNEFERLWMLESVGALGEGKTDLERCQEMQEKIGQTKKSHMKTAIEEREKRRQLPLLDARPPDTIRALLSHSGKKRKEQSDDTMGDTTSKGSKHKHTKTGLNPPELSSDSDTPLAMLPSSPTKLTPGRRSGAFTTPKGKRTRAANLMSSPIRPLKSPIVNHLRSGHQALQKDGGLLPKKVTFDNVIGHNIPSCSTTIVQPHASRSLLGSYNTEHLPTGVIQFFVASGLDQLIGYRWGKRSCWLDTPLENFFWTVMRCPDAVDSIVTAEGGSDLGLTNIIRTLNVWKMKLLSGADNNTMALELASSKQELQKYLVIKHNGSPSRWTTSQDLDKDHNDIGWLAAALGYVPFSISGQPASPAQIALQHHFCIWLLRYRFCLQGDPAPEDPHSQPWGHYYIDPVSRDYPVPNLYARDYQHYRGDFQWYISGHMEVREIGTPAAC